LFIDVKFTKKTSAHYEYRYSNRNELTLCPFRADVSVVDSFVWDKRPTNATKESGTSLDHCTRFLPARISPGQPVVLQRLCVVWICIMSAGGPDASVTVLGVKLESRNLIHDDGLQNQLMQILQVLADFSLQFKEVDKRLEAQGVQFRELRSFAESARLLVVSLVWMPHRNAKV
jgi:hypothetical protein